MMGTLPPASQAPLAWCFWWRTLGIPPSLALRLWAAVVDLDTNAAARVRCGLLALHHPCFMGDPAGVLAALPRLRLVLTPHLLITILEQAVDTGRLARVPHVMTVERELLRRCDAHGNWLVRAIV